MPPPDVRSARAKTWVAVATLVASVSIVGCAGLDMPDSNPWGTMTAKLPWGDDGEEPAIPTRITALWTNTILNQSGKSGVRGFGGRLMFYNDNQSEPHRVDGTLTVYAFDDTGQVPTHITPERRYVFLSEHLQKHYSKSQLGHSYSLWLPWDEVGGTPKQVSLVIRFEPTEGAAVISEPIRQSLPGIAVSPDLSDQDGAEAKRLTGQKNYGQLFDEGGPVRQVVHEVLAKGAKQATNSKKKRMSTISIDVPSQFARRNLKHNADLLRRHVEIQSAISSDDAESRSAQGESLDLDELDIIDVDSDDADIASRAQLHAKNREPSIDDRTRFARARWYRPRGSAARRSRFARPLSPVRTGPTPQPSALHDSSQPNRSDGRSSHSDAPKSSHQMQMWDSDALDDQVISESSWAGARK